MRLNELLNKPLPWKQVKNTSDEIVYHFELPDGRTYSIDYEDMGSSPDFKAWEVSFSDVNDNSRKKYGMSGKGQQIAILSTSFANLAEFTNHNPNDVLFFTADDTKRASIYNRLSSKYFSHFITGPTSESATAFYVGKPETVAAHKEIMDKIH